ncbi:MAG: SDR family NAD(P)-dependent oxidoreductase [Abditibacteriaceae bacterium]
MTDNQWKDQVAIITGGADGLGFALAQRLILNGVFVVVFDRNTEKVEAAKSTFGNSGAGFVVDVTDPTAVNEAVGAIIEDRGRIDILANCAGITGKTNIQSHEVTLEDFDHVMNVNLRGSLITFQAIIPYMLEANYGRVLHIASISGKEGNAGMLAYSTSKAAVIGMTKVQGKEYANTGITINAIAPAVLRTAMVEVMPEEQVKYMTDKIPMNRCGTLDEFAAIASFILSSEAGFNTAFTFDLSGGRATY